MIFRFFVDFSICLFLMVRVLCSLFFTFITENSNSDLMQYISACLAYCMTDYFYHTLAVKICNIFKNFGRKVFFRIKATSKEKYIQYAECSHFAEFLPEIGFFHPLKPAACSSVHDFHSVVFPIILGKLCSDMCKMFCQNLAAWNAKIFLQGYGYRIKVLRLIFPEIQVAGILINPCIRHIKDVSDSRMTAADTDKTYPLCSTFDITTHTFVPDINSCTCRSQWALCMD